MAAFRAVLWALPRHHFRSHYTPLLKNSSHRLSIHRSHSHARILGIETSCDDTGVAIIDTDGVVLAEALYSQSEFHTQLGGVNPPIARDLHAINVEKAVRDVLLQSRLSALDLSAIAVTTRPGLVLALNEGLRHARQMALDAGLPLIPIHHMEAHALTPRLEYPELDFPFLVLLASGGHCILALVRGVADFLLLGTCHDQAPGDLFDKAARRLKLTNLPECRRLGGGQAIELMAKRGDASVFPFGHVMLAKRDCNFSFSGLHCNVHQLIEREEERLGVVGGDVLPNAADISAGLLSGVAKHLALRIVRAWNYCDLMGIFPEGRRRRLVMSGGVAANAFLRTVVRRVCEKHDADLICPPPRLCTDNGVMIAWNAVERWRIGDRGIKDQEELERIEPVGKSPLGEDAREDVYRRGIKVKTKEIDALVEGEAPDTVPAGSAD